MPHFQSRAWSSWHEYFDQVQGPLPPKVPSWRGRQELRKLAFVSPLHPGSGRGRRAWGRWRWWGEARPLNLELSELVLENQSGKWLCLPVVPSPNFTMVVKEGRKGNVDRKTNLPGHPHDRIQTTITVSCTKSLQIRTSSFDTKEAWNRKKVENNCWECRAVRWVKQN